MNDRTAPKQEVNDKMNHKRVNYSLTRELLLRKIEEKATCKQEINDKINQKNEITTPVRENCS